MKFVICLVFLVSLLMCTVYAEKQFFYVFSTDGPYKVEPGAIFNLNITIDNKGLRAPKNVTILVEECPSDWDCESKTMSWNKTGRFDVPLRVSVPKSAIQRKYSLRIGLSSYNRVERGDDAVLIWVSEEANPPKSKYIHFTAGDNTKKVTGPTGKRATTTYIYEEETPRYYQVDETPKDIAEPDIEVLTEDDIQEMDEEEQAYDALAVVDESIASKEVDELTGDATGTAEEEVTFWKYAVLALYALLIMTAIGAYSSLKNRK